MTRKQEPPFWLVWCEDGGAPTRKHETPERAEAEAIRLAQQSPGKSFCVLAMIARVTNRSGDAWKKVYVADANAPEPTAFPTKAILGATSKRTRSPSRWRRSARPTTIPTASKPCSAHAADT